jgi:heme o synthase
MKRTQNRALVTGAIRGRNALLYAVILGMLGIGVLFLFTNLLTLAIGLFGMFMYVVVYGAAKRAGSYSTLVGSIPGALPPVAGYVAASGVLNLTALILFLILVAWQMPHFYAIALRRKNEYAAASLPVLSTKLNTSMMKQRIMVYILLFGLFCCGLAFYGGFHIIYFCLAVIIAISWFLKGLLSYENQDHIAWATGMFLHSLFVLLTICTAIAISPWLP